MSKEDVYLGYLGQSFQLKLISQMMTDHKFAGKIIDIMEPKYFDDEYMRLIVSKLKDYHEKYDTIPNYDTLEMIIKTDIKRDVTKDFVLDVIKEVKDADLRDSIFIQEKSLKFCKQQELKKANTEISKILNSGDFERYDDCEELLKKALAVGDGADDTIDVFENLGDVLSDDFRSPVPTGIAGIDSLMGGGLSKGELGVVLSSYGVGKTTLATKFANSAFNEGYNVVQIFFEDNPKVIQRKHLACWTGIELNELVNNKEFIQHTVAKIRKEGKGHLKLKKFPSDGTTMNHIKQYLRSLISDGMKPDIVLLDYIDCVCTTEPGREEWSGEGKIMRQYETMISELDMVGWTFVQGNRSAIDQEVIGGSQMGGSIKKGQIGHFIMSVGKTMDQREDGLATISILKSRFGKDGIIFQDVAFDNGRVYINTEETGGMTLLEHRHEKEKERSAQVTRAIEAAKAKN